MRRSWQLWIATLSLTGVVAANAQQRKAPGLTMRIATLLAAADEAAADPKGVKHALKPLLQTLTRLGARPATGDDAISEWSTLVKPSEEETPVWRGRVLGPAYHRGALAPSAAFRSEQLFSAGELASVSVSTVPKSPVQMTVTASGANPCPSSTTECSWRPIFTQRYTITVQNKGSVPLRYYVVFE